MDTHAKKQNCDGVDEFELILCFVVCTIAIVYCTSVGSEEYSADNSEVKINNQKNHDSKYGKAGFGMSWLWCTSDCLRRFSMSRCPGPFCSVDVSTPSIFETELAGGFLSMQRAMSQRSKAPYDDFTPFICWSFAV